MTTEFKCHGALMGAATMAPCLALGQLPAGVRARESDRCALVVVSDSAFVRREFAETAATVGTFALAGTCDWSQLSECCDRLRPDMVVLDRSVVPSIARWNQVRGLRERLRRPVIALLLAQGAALSEDVDVVDAVLSTEFGVAPVLEALRVLMSGVVMSVGPQSRDAYDDPAVDSEARRRLSALTVREHEILSLITDGLSNREVSSRLFISPDTVKEHVSRILAKLQVTSRIEAAVVAVRAEVGGPQITHAARRIHS